MPPKKPRPRNQIGDARSPEERYRLAETGFYETAGLSRRYAPTPDELDERTDDETPPEVRACRP